jgi:hypothetical protein
MAKDKAAKGKRTTVSPASEASKVTPAPEKTKAKPGVVHAPSKGAAAADVKVAAQESKNRNADDAASTSSAKKAMSSKPTSPTAGAAKTKAATKTSAADAKAAKKRLITSVSDALAGGWKLGDAFRESFLGTQDYQQVRGVAFTSNSDPWSELQQVGSTLDRQASTCVGEARCRHDRRSHALGGGSTIILVQHPDHLAPPKRPRGDDHSALGFTCLVGRVGW